MNEDVTPPSQAVLTEIIQLQHKVRGGVGWFFIVAGLSLINTLIFLFGGELNFVVGLGITQLIDGFATGFAQQANSNMSTTIYGVGIGLDLVIFGFFVAVSYFARKRYQASFIVGLIVYALDALIMLAFSVWVGVIFHLLGLVGMWGGFQAARRLNQLEQSGYEIPEDPTFVIPKRERVKTVRDRTYWSRLVLPALVLLIPLILFLIMLLFYSA